MSPKSGPAAVSFFVWVLPGETILQRLRYNKQYQAKQFFTGNLWRTIKAAALHIYDFNDAKTLRIQVDQWSRNFVWPCPVSQTLQIPVGPVCRSYVWKIGQIQPSLSCQNLAWIFPSERYKGVPSKQGTDIRDSHCQSCDPDQNQLVSPYANAGLGEASAECDWDRVQGRHQLTSRTRALLLGFRPNKKKLL